MHVKLKILFLVLLGVSAFASETYAATLYFDPSEKPMFRGDSATIAVRLDTDEGECVNTVDATIVYDADIRAVDVARGESILSIWLEDPVIDEVNRTIQFAGGIPGGYCGRIAGDPSLTNVIAELVFRLPGLHVGSQEDDGEARVVFSDTTQVLLHDGFGTQADLRFQNATFLLNDKPGASIVDDWSPRVTADSVPPADFSITISSSDTAFSGEYFIVFNTIDKQSGIDHYEVMEEPFDEFDLFNWGRVDAPWVRATSPYVLKDQSLNSTIRVKAVDKAGNETIAILVPDRALRTLSIDRLLSIVTFGFIGVFVFSLVAYAIYRRRKQIVASEQFEQIP